MQHSDYLDHNNDRILNEMKISNSEIHFSKLIYQAAKNPNKDEAKAIINKLLVSVAIDIYQGKTSGPAVYQLAAEGEVEAVNFLRKEFNASSLWAVSGYAQGEYETEINKIFAQTINPTERFELLQYKMFGYALGKHAEKANKTLAQVTNPKELLLLQKEMVSGYSRNGHIAETNIVLNQPTERTEQLELMQCAALGHTLRGNVTEANNILAQAINPEEQLILRKEMISGYSRSGDVVEVNKILGQANNPEEQLTLGREAICGYARGGHIAKANKAREEITDPLERFNLLQYEILGYAQSGNVAEANKLLDLAMKPSEKLTLLKEKTRGYIIRGHIVEVNKVLAQHGKNYSHYSTAQSHLPKVIVDNLNKAAFSDNRSALQVIAMFNTNFHKDIVNELKESKEIKIDMKGLAEKATKINIVMTTQKLNFSQAMDWIQPEIQIWLLQGHQLIKNKKFHAAIFLRIATFLSPNTLEDMTDLTNKLTLTIRRERFFNNLKIHNQLLPSQLMASSSENCNYKTQPSH